MSWSYRLDEWRGASLQAKLDLVHQDWANATSTCLDQAYACCPPSPTCQNQTLGSHIASSRPQVLGSEPHAASPPSPMCHHSPYNQALCTWYSAQDHGSELPDIPWRAKQVSWPNTRGQLSSHAVGYSSSYLLIFNGKIHYRAVKLATMEYYSFWREMLWQLLESVTEVLSCFF